MLLSVKTNLEEWRIKLIELESKLKESHIQIVEKRVEIPIEVVKIDERRVRELEEENRRLISNLEELRIKITSL